MATKKKTQVTIYRPAPREFTVLHAASVLAQYGRVMLGQTEETRDLCEAIDKLHSGAGVDVPGPMRNLLFAAGFLQGKAEALGLTANELADAEGF